MGGIGETVALLVMISLTGPTGARIDINPNTVTSIRDPSAMPKGHWSENTHCIVVVDGGDTIAVRETCDEVRQAIGEK